MWTPYEYVLNNSMRSIGSKKGKWIWSIPSFETVTSNCDPNEGYKKGGGTVQIVARDTNCNSQRSIRFEASFSGYYHSSATNMAQAGFNPWIEPPYEWGSSLIDLGFLPKGKEYVRYNEENGFPQAAFSYVIDFKLPCAPGNALNSLIPPGITLRFIKRDFGLKDDCTVFIEAQESYKIFWDPTISASFRSIWEGLLESGDFTTARDAVITYLGDSSLDGHRVILGPAEAMLSGIVTTGLDSVYQSSDIYLAFVALQGENPLNGGLGIGE
jgi:hypothetical protein